MAARCPLFVALLVLAFVARLATGVWWQQRLPAETRFAFGDSESYWVLARNIAQGEPYRYGVEGAEIFRTPGYPLLLAPLFLLFGAEPPVLAARALSALLATASLAVVVALARTLFNDRTALLAACALAIDPGTITLGVFVLSEAPFCPLLLLNLWAWVLAWRARSNRELYWHSIWGGVAAGLAVLMRPSWLLFLPFAAVVGLLAISGSETISQKSPTANSLIRSLRMKHVGICLTMLFTLCLTLLPWWYRSYSITGRFIPTTLQVGASLYDGLGPQADGSSHMEFVPQFIAEQQAADAAGEASPLRTFEERLDRRMQTASVAWAKEHPQRVAELAGIKFLRMWSPWPNGGELGSFTTRLAIAAGYLPLLVLSLWGVYRYAWRDWSFLLLVLPGVYFTLLHVVFVSSIRYRQPALLPLAILGAAVLVSGTVANVRKITPLLCVRKAASRKR